MSFNDYTPQTNATYDYVLKYTNDDFIYTHLTSSFVPDASSCETLNTQNPCGDDTTDTESCMQQRLCRNKELSDKVQTVIRTNNEGKRRQTDESAIYDNAVQTCITLCLGIVGMVLTVVISLRKVALPPQQINT
jgi:hypothetical protein